MHASKDAKRAWLLLAGLLAPAQHTPKKQLVAECLCHCRNLLGTGSLFGRSRAFHGNLAAGLAFGHHGQDYIRVDAVAASWYAIFQPCC